MELDKKFKTSFLKPAKYNPRMMDEEEHQELEEAINYFGLVDPIIFNTKSGVIIGGRQRYEHIKDNEYGYALLLGDIGWYFTEEDLKLDGEADEKALNIALNKIGGKFDNSLLKPMIETLLDTDTPVIGFNDMEINEIVEEGFTNIDPEEGFGKELPEKGEYNKEPEQRKVKTFYLKEGDTWNIGNHKLIVGPVDDYQKINVNIKGGDLKVVLSSTDNVDADMYLFMSKNKETIANNSYNYQEETEDIEEVEE